MRMFRLLFHVSECPDDINANGKKLQLKFTRRCSTAV
jgi:hypothetical protein